MSKKKCVREASSKARAKKDSATPRSVEEFNHKLYRKLALVIHEELCEAPEWCTYGKPIPEELQDDERLSWPERQDRARKRLYELYDCQTAVDAENIAARVQFGKGSKVRPRR